MKEISLTQGFVAIVDDEDYERINAYKWQVNRKDRDYAYAHLKLEQLQEGELPGTRLYMHRVVLGLRTSVMGTNNPVDHINRDGLDNRKSNLRIVTPRQNMLNSKIRIDNSSGIKGLSWVERKKSWRAYANKQGRQLHLYVGKNFVRAYCARIFWEKNL